MSVPVLSVAQMRDWEKASWAAGKSEPVVIARVGRILAERLRALTRPGDAILLLAGKGHNGDDVRAAREHLHDRAVVLLNVNDPKSAAMKLLDAVQAQPPGWMVDGLFGIGLNGPLDADWQNLVKTINNIKLPILAMDTPSGLNADTGEVEGASIKAAITLTVGAPKIGLLKAGEYTGRLEVAPEIGLIPCPVNNELNWTLPEDFAGFPPRRPVDGHKGTFGHAAIIAGSTGYHGACVLAARGASRSQPGLVTVYPQESVYVPVAAQLQAVMAHPWQAGKPLPKSCTAVLIGPGLAAEKLPEALREETRSLWRTSPIPVIVDASALAWLEPGDTPQGAIRVITPHPGEAAKLLGVKTDEVQEDRARALRKLSRHLGNCHVILKGNQTLVGRADGNIFINSSGNPFLGQGGAGDLLGGYLAGLLAQPVLQSEPMTTIRFAVWQHGAAADRLAETRSNWTIDDLANEIGDLKLWPGATKV